MDAYNFQITVYLAFFFLAFAFSALANQLFLKLLKNLGPRSLKNGEENLIRWASQAKPAIGGFTFFIVFLLSVISYFILPFGSKEAMGKELFTLLGSVSLGFLIGWIDDSYNTPPKFKLFGQLACAAILVAMDILIPISGIAIIDIIFTTVWVVGIMNSINMLDNMDGITATVSTCILISAFIFALLLGGVTGFYTIVLLGSIATLLAFLYFNWHPSKVYMGDTGSQFLGMLLAFVSIQLMWQFRGAAEGMFSFQQFLVPAVAFLLPIIDTSTVVFWRLKRGASPFQGGRDHTTHHLVYCGLNDRQVAYVFLFFSLLSILICYWIVQNLPTWTFQHSLLISAYCISVFGLSQFYYIKGKRLQETKLANQQNEGKVYSLDSKTNDKAVGN